MVSIVPCLDRNLLGNCPEHCLAAQPTGLARLVERESLDRKGDQDTDVRLLSVPLVCRNPVLSGS